MFRRQADEDFGKYERAFRTVSPGYKGAFRSWLKRIFFLTRIRDGQEIMKVSSHPTVRCLECGWRYAFTLSSHCSVCESDRALLLIAEDPYSKPWNIVFYTALAIAIWTGGIIYFGN